MEQRSGEVLVDEVHASEAELLRRTANHLDGAEVIELACGPVVAMGAGRFVNRLCVLRPPTVEDVEALIELFEERGMPPTAQVPQTVDAVATPTFAAAGFEPVERRAVLGADPSEIGGRRAPNLAAGGSWVRIEEVDEATEEAWLGVIAGANEVPPRRRRISDEYALANRAIDGATDYLLSIDDEPVAAASLIVVEDIGWLGGAGTLPPARGRGAQSALLAHRIAVADRPGCRWVAATAEPESVSQRNMEWAGLTVVDTQVVMRRPAADTLPSGGV